MCEFRFPRFLLEEKNCKKRGFRDGGVGGATWKRRSNSRASKAHVAMRTFLTNLAKVGVLGQVDVCHVRFKGGRKTKRSVYSQE